MTGILKVDQIQNIEDASSVKVNRTTSDGTVLDIQKDGTSAGTIKTVSGVTLALDGSGSFVGFQLGGTGIVPRQGGTLSTSVDLGTSSYPFDNVYVGSNIYLGGTGSANALDDYEEGTWTPAFGVISGSATYTTQVGNYVKVGRMVTGTFWIVVNVSSSLVSDGISGLPFTGNNTNYAGVSFSSYESGAFSGYNNLLGLVAADTTIQFRGTTSATSAPSTISVSITNGTIVTGSVTYFTS